MRVLGSLNIIWVINEICILQRNSRAKWKEIYEIFHYDVFILSISLNACFSSYLMNIFHLRVCISLKIIALNSREDLAATDKAHASTYGMEITRNEFSERDSQKRIISVLPSLITSVKSNSCSVIPEANRVACIDNSQLRQTFLGYAKPRCYNSQSLRRYTPPE